MKKIFKLVAINIFVFFGILYAANFCAILFFKLEFKLKSVSNSNADVRPGLPNYRSLPWASTHFQEFNSLPAEYRSYVGWRRLEYNGKTIKIDKDGIRNTPQSTLANPSAPLIAFLGGSTTWGTGANDSSTIPALFSFISNGKYRTINLGETGYNAFQSFLFFKLQMMNGLKPDFIITYDGVNNEYIEGKRPNSHAREVQIINVMKNQDQGDHNVMKFEHFIKPLKVFISRYLTGPKLIASTYTINDSIRIQNNKLNAIELLESWLSMKELADQNKIVFMAILQPNAFVGSPKIDHLKLNEADSAKFVYYKYVFELLNDPKYSKLKPCVLDYTHKFDKGEYIYIDDCHVSPNGNLIIAESILQDLNNLGKLENINK